MEITCVWASCCLHGARTARALTRTHLHKGRAVGSDGDYVTPAPTGEGGSRHRGWWWVCVMFRNQNPPSHAKHTLRDTHSWPDSCMCVCVHENRNVKNTAWHTLQSAPCVCVCVCVCERESRKSPRQLNTNSSTLCQSCFSCLMSVLFLRVTQKQH